MLATLIFAAVSMQTFPFPVAPAGASGLREFGLTSQSVMYFEQNDQVLEWNSKEGQLAPNRNLQPGKVLQDGSILTTMGLKASRVIPPSRRYRPKGPTQDFPDSFNAWNVEGDIAFGEIVSRSDSTSVPAIVERGKVARFVAPSYRGLNPTSGQTLASIKGYVIGSSTYKDKGSYRTMPVFWSSRRKAILPIMPPGTLTSSVVGVGSGKVYGNLESAVDQRACEIKLNGVKVLPLPPGSGNSEVLAVCGDIAVGVYGPRQDPDRACAWYKGRFIDLTSTMAIRGLRFKWATSVNLKGEILCRVQGADRESRVAVIRPKLR